MHSAELHFDNTWTLFLDRDGVINRKIEGDYVRNWDQFTFLPGALDALKALSGVFGRIIILTNQRGVAKGLMTEADLIDIHRRMVEEIARQGGRVDLVIYNTDLHDEGSLRRKPQPGMALEARERFPEIRFSRAVMVGDAHSDIALGRNLGMCTVCISEKEDFGADYRFPDLAHFSSQVVHPR